jgi:hypothetical protein
MATLTREQNLTNGRYTVKLTITTLTAEETDLLTDFGTPAIEVGGDIIKAPDTVVGTLDSSTRKVNASFTVTQSFDLSKFLQPEVAALAWGDQVVSRVKAALDSLRAKFDTFTETTTEEV